MYDKELVLTILGQIYQAAQTILKRFEPVKNSKRFYRLTGRQGALPIC
jgi:hypothetical protein